MENDPLTRVPALIAMIEPGPRMIDGTLLKQLLSTAGLAGLAASIENGPRLIDGAALRRMATQILAVQTAELYRTTEDPGPRLHEGILWKALSMMTAGQIAPLIVGVSDEDKAAPSGAGTEDRAEGRS